MYKSITQAFIDKCICIYLLILRGILIFIILRIHSASDILSLYQDPSGTVDIKLRDEMEKKNSELKSIFTDEMKSKGIIM
jgi:hypothetical protein